jgi:hypothetical protein
VRTPIQANCVLCGLEALMEALMSEAATLPLPARVEALERMDRLRDPRVVPFMLRLLANDSGPTKLRIHIVRLLRNGRLSTAERPQVANALIELLDRPVEARLKLQIVLALGEFTQVPGALEALGNVAAADEPVDVRYAAFTSIQRAGPQLAGVRILMQLLEDETLGPSIRALLREWHLT